MKTHKWADIKAKKLAPETVERVRREADADVLEMNLRSLRESTGTTQEQLARATEMSQSELSRVERREDHLLSTLRRYVKALGGDLEVVAVIGGKRVTLHGVG